MRRAAESYKAGRKGQQRADRAAVVRPAAHRRLPDRAPCASGNLDGVRRVIFSRRWILRHLIVVAFFFGFLALGWWQWQRAEGGNGRSFGYMFEWPLFAAFLVFFWWRMVQMDAAERAESEAPSQEDPAAAAGQAGASPTAARQLVRRRAAQRTAAAIQDEPDEAMDAYNAYLATLTAADAAARSSQRTSRTDQTR